MKWMVGVGIRVSRRSGIEMAGGCLEVWTAFADSMKVHTV